MFCSDRGRKQEVYIILHFVTAGNVLEFDTV